MCLQGLPGEQGPCGNNGAEGDQVSGKNINNSIIDANNQYHVI